MTPVPLLPRGSELSLSTLGRDLTPYPAEQRLTLYILAGYLVFTAVLCILPMALQLLIHPWVLFDTAIHEFCHAIVIVLTGGQVTSVKIQISGGGVTYGYTRGRSPLLVLPAGHLGSAVVSASLVLAGFSILAAKIASLIVAAIMLLSLAWVVKDKVSIPTTFFAVLIMVPLWLLWHARPLRFYILFVGAVTSVHNLAILVQAQFIRIPPGSDVDQFAKASCGSPKVWGFVWILLAFVFFGIAVLTGILINVREQYLEAQKFLPT